jgi:hypothetical protein
VKKDASIDPVSIVQRLSRDELQTIVLESLKIDDTLARRIILRFAPATSAETIGAILDRLKKEHTDDDWGHIENSEALGDSLEELGRKAEEAAEAGDFATAMMIDTTMISRMAGYASNGDDEYGAVEDQVDEAFERLAILAESYDFDESTRLALRTWSENNIESSWAKAHNSWDISCLCLMENSSQSDDESRETLARCLRIVDSIGEDRRNGAAARGGIAPHRTMGEHSRRSAEKAVMIAIRLYGSMADPEARKRFIDAHMHVAPVRDLAIDEAVARGNYSLALSLAREGLSAQSAAGSHGLVSAYEDRIVEILDLDGRAEDASRFIEELCLAERSIDRFRLLKKRGSDRKLWIETRERILVVFETRKDWVHIADILQEEHLGDRLLALTDRIPGLFDRYYAFIGKTHPERVIPYLEKKIPEYFRSAGSRSDYANCAGKFSEYSGYAGPHSARALIRNIIAEYPNRPAMRDELGKILERMN